MAFVSKYGGSEQNENIEEINEILAGVIPDTAIELVCEAWDKKQVNERGQTTRE